MSKSLLSAFVLAVSLCIFGKDVTIDGTAQVKMEIKTPSEAEKTAMAELKSYVKRIFAEHKGKSAAKAQIILRHDPKLGEEEFKIKCADGKVIITGGRPTGVIYGAYWFLDRKLGVHWFDPYSEYCPSKEKIVVAEFEKFGKPAFVSRAALPGATDEGIRWATYNLLNSNRPVAEKELNKKYGENSITAPPLGSHGMLGLIPGYLYKDHPEYFAFQNGQRIDAAKRGVTVDYCLTNEGLIKETAKRAIYFLKKAPKAKFLHMGEGDGNKGMCGCKPCQDLIKKHGNRESARWIYFANRVGEIVKKEFPNVKLVVFAYINSVLPPKDMKANDNVAVQIVTLGVRRGRPYMDPKNKMANKFMKNVVQEWQKVCKHILFWDYVWGGTHWMTYPDQLMNVTNVRDVHAMGITDGFFPEEIGLMTSLQVKQGCPFRPWILARAMWDPEECYRNGEALETMFCNEYYGPAAGPYVDKYFKYLRKVHWESGFVGMTSGGPLVAAPYEAPEVTAECYKILMQGYEAAKKEQNRTHIRRAYEAMLPVMFLIGTDYAKVKKHVKLDKSAAEIIEEIRNYIRGKSKTQKDWLRYKRQHRALNLIDGIGNIVAYASREYGLGKASTAYDGKLNTNWTPGLGIGWTMIDLGENRFINRITTVFHQARYVRRTTYVVEGSFDMKAWRVMVPKRTVTVPEKLQQEGNLHEIFNFDDVILPKDVEARYIRTRIIKAERRLGTGEYGGQDAQLTEQMFNIREIPEQLKKSMIKE